METRQTSIVEAAGLLSASLVHAFGNEAAVLAGPDPEGVHQMRVGLRRFRSCVGLFKDVMQLGSRRWVKAGLAPLLDLLGPARDWDVFIGEQLPAVRLLLDERDGIDLIDRAARRSQARVYRALRRFLKSAGHARARSRLTGWVKAEEWREVASARGAKLLAEPVMSFARSCLQAGHRRLRKRGGHLDRRSEEELHALRIAIKKQRYAVEFFADLFQASQLQPYLKALKRMQTELGHLNDGAVARRLLGEAGSDRRRKADCRRVLEAIADGSERSRQGLPVLWRGFKGCRPFWR